MKLEKDIFEIDVTHAQTERELIESFGLEYVRIPVADHCSPSDQSVDQFVELIKNLPDDAWLHFHCRGGRGRTTTFLTLYDIMVNAKQVSLDPILARHFLLGGTDLLRLHNQDNYKHLPATERLKFVKKFYNYCLEVPDFSTPWSEWVNNSHHGK